MNNLFDEDHLPEGQDIIQTSNVQRFQEAATILLKHEKRYAKIGVITAPAGTGKTIAAQACCDTFLAEQASLLPTCIKVKATQNSTVENLNINIRRELGEPAKWKKREKLQEGADYAATAIERTDLGLIIIDECDWFQEESFDMVRYHLDRTGCPILLVGLRKILRVIERQEKFHSRVGLYMDFQALTIDEINETVLPQLVFPCWSFNPKNPHDREMGEAIWQKVQPSLRKLRNLLERAGDIAQIKKEKAITLATIEEAYTWVATPQEIARATAQAKKQKPAKKQTHEDISEQRHKAKEGKGGHA